MLVCAAFLADASVVVSGVRWPAPNADSFKLALLWFALGLSLTVYLVLRAPRDDGDDGRASEAPPEPPWWARLRARLPRLRALRAAAAADRPAAPRRHVLVSPGS